MAIQELCRNSFLFCLLVHVIVDNEAGDYTWALTSTINLDRFYN